jgi:hypothetical protein
MTIVEVIKNLEIIAAKMDSIDVKMGSINATLNNIYYVFLVFLQLRLFILDMG